MRGAIIIEEVAEEFKTEMEEEGTPEELKVGAEREA